MVRRTLVAIVLVIAVVGCETSETDLAERCMCGPEIEGVAASCLEAVMALDSSVTERDQVVKDEVERQLYTVRDELRVEIGELRDRVESLEGSP